MTSSSGFTGTLKMSNLNVEWIDETLIVMGLGLILATLPTSGYDPELRKQIEARVKDLLDKIQKPKVYDAYGNPY